MAYRTEPYIENPNLRQAAALIVDDPAPCINPLWYFRNQVTRQAQPVYCRDIPVSFMQEWCNWIRDADIRGDFTVLPYPAGLGRVDEGLDGYDTGEVREWMSLARTVVAPQFDIHCEILTHTRALDLATNRLMDVSEHEWSDTQNEETLADYFAAAMAILRDAELPNHGMTQPCTYLGDESMYARAVLEAEKRVNGRHVTHNFLHMDSVSHRVDPRVTFCDEGAGEAVVSIWTGIDDYIWNTQEPGNAAGTQDPGEIADRYLTADGSAGRLRTLLDGGGPLVLVTHWQSLYSNGTGQGLRVYREVVERIKSHLSAHVEWRKLSEITSHFLAAQTAKMETTATFDEVSVEITSPFASDVLTVSVPMPWPLFTGPLVTLDGSALTQTDSETTLSAGKWLMRGSVVTVSIPVHAQRTAQLRITKRKE